MVLALILWALISIGAYPLHQVVRSTRESLQPHCRSARERLGRTLSHLAERLRGTLSPFADSHRLRELRDKGHTTWVQSMQLLTGSLDRMSEQAAHSATSLSAIFS